MENRKTALLAWLFVGALLLPAGCSSPAPIDHTLPQHGTRALPNPHNDWGALVDLQDAKALEALNGFFAGHGLETGFPPGMMVRPHPNGKSLIYEWLGDDGQWQGLQQSGRSSLFFAAISANGKNFKAQERDWGFVVSYRDFHELSWPTRAALILHEFYHQSQQIHYHGTFRYWYCYSVQFISKGYWQIDGEKQAFALNKCFETFLKERYGLTIRSKNTPCRRCGVALPNCSQDEN